MKLEHIALTVSLTEEIKNFYINVLGMKQIKNFVLRHDLAVRIFGIDEEVNVYLMQNEQLVLELFISAAHRKQAFDHICFSIKNRESLVDKVRLNGYKVIRIERKEPDLIFVRDKDGNIFEIKEL